MSNIIFKICIQEITTAIGNDIKCKHKFKIDPDFKSGMFTMISGKIGDLKEEDRYECIKCLENIKKWY